MTSPDKILRKFFLRKKKSQAGFSYRLLARELGVSSSYVSAVFSGKKKFSFERLDQLGRLLDMDQHALGDLKKFYFPVAALAMRLDSKISSYAYVDKSGFKILRTWYHLAILDLTTCSNFRGSRQEISERLSLDPKTTSIAVNELLALGLLTEETGVLCKTQDHIRWASAIPNELIRSFHRQMLEKTNEELTKSDTASFLQREISGMTLAVNPENIPLAKRLLSEKIHEVAELLGQGATSEVYHLGFQLVPLTRSTKS